jgi:subtilisin family serine protease
MQKYIVKIANPDVRQRLVDRFEKVGTPTSYTDIIIVTTNQSISSIQAVEGVIHVESDGFAEVTGFTVDDPEPPHWALAWISNSNGSYRHTKTGKDVDIYVLDTGVRDTHEDLIGRVRNLYSHDDVFYNVVGGPSPFHGTAVASCAAGTKHGTAKLATIVNCRIDFSFTEIVKALDTILADHLNKDSTRPSILNFSGTSTSSLIGDLFERLVNYGIVVVASSGNDNEPIPRFPARNDWIIDVGALDGSSRPATFTNRRTSMYLPGVAVPTAHVFSDTATTLTSGTSFSAPYYAGLLACVLEDSDRFNTRTQVSNFEFRARMDLGRTDYIPQFENGGYQVRTPTTIVYPNVWYTNPSFAFSDSEINEFCAANIHNPQHIAEMAREYNVDLNRFVRATNHSAEEVNAFFASANVTPWWK